jgi:hypothetical protein
MRHYDTPIIEDVRISRQLDYACMGICNILFTPLPTEVLNIMSATKIFANGRDEKIWEY